jgi:Fe2+ transport system protein FeoA
MGLFRRRKPLHERLADAGGIADELTGAQREPAPGLAAEAPGWDGEQRGEPGIHGVPRARRWDTVANVEAPALTGDAVHFVALPDGTLVLDEDEPDDALAPLADAVEQTLPAPYRAEAVRKGPETWAVAASRIAVAQVPGLTGDQVELTSTREGRVVRVDGRTTMGSVRELERLGEIEGTEYVVLAKRLDGDLWEVEATAL